MNKLSQSDFEHYAEGNKNKQYIMDSYQKLRELLQKYKFDGHDVNVFLQGSYRNDTDINFDSDIDIVVFYDGEFFCNIKNEGKPEQFNKNINLTTEDLSRFNQWWRQGAHSYSEYKNDVKNYIEQNKQLANIDTVEIGNKTIKCKIRNSNFYFDVICAMPYHLYQNFLNPNNYILGNYLISEQGEGIINFPKQTYENSVEKNKNTGKYKETVRIIKSIMKHDCDKNSWIPSFALESILYNVSDVSYNIDAKRERVKTVIGEALSLVYNNWLSLLEPNEILYVKNIKRIDQNKALNILNLMNSRL